MSLTPRSINFEEYWKDLSGTLNVVIRCGKLERKIWNDRFSDVYALCVATPEPFTKTLYNKTKQFLEDHVKEILRNIQNAGDLNLILAYYQSWEQYSKGSQYIHALYTYLNQQYIKKKKTSEPDILYGDMEIQLMEIGELAYDIWKRELIMPIQKNLLSAILDEVHKDRLQKSTMNHRVINSVIHSFVTVDENGRPKSQLSLYKKIFEDPYLNATSEFYSQKASANIAVLSCYEYLEKALQWIDEEECRSLKYIHSSSYKLNRSKVEERLAYDNIGFLHAECETLVKLEQEKDLRNMYLLLKPVKGVQRLCECLEAHIKKTGLCLIESLTEDNIHQQFVESMLALHRKYSLMVKAVFNNDQLCIAVLDRACAAVINHKPPSRHYSKSPEMLVKYCDSLLRKSIKSLSEADIDDKLNSSITVFKYLSDKDIYQQVYQKMLCRRLIYRLSSSMDTEEAMINRLKQTCGYEFTNKLHRMFTDINISTDLTNKFLEDSKNKEANLQHGFSILVLQAGAWPISSQKIPLFQLPSELEHGVQLFEKFYENKFSGRKLSWVHAYSTGEVKLNYLAKPYTANLGLFQMAILIQYNDGDMFSAEELRERTKLEEKDWARHVLPLVDAKLITEVDKKFILNMDYSNKRTKFKIMPVGMKETPQETEKIRYNTDEDRKWQIQAAIVRIMKARKLLRHNLLIEEVINQLKSRFSPSVSLIKKSIEALIEKQYMERAQNSKDEYSYVA